MPSVQPNRLVPGRHGHLSAAAASAFAARTALQAGPKPSPPVLRLVPAPASEKLGDGVRAARRHRASVIAQDHASYQCGCGNLFTAVVSTTVTCPGCGDNQSW